jgi:hypothetical protein
MMRQSCLSKSAFSSMYFGTYVVFPHPVSPEIIMTLCLSIFEMIEFLCLAIGNYRLYNVISYPLGLLLDTKIRSSHILQLVCVKRVCSMKSLSPFFLLIFPFFIGIRISLLNVPLLRYGGLQKYSLSFSLIHLAKLVSLIYIY